MYHMLEGSCKFDVKHDNGKGNRDSQFLFTGLCAVAHSNLSPQLPALLLSFSVLTLCTCTCVDPQMTNCSDANA